MLNKKEANWNAGSEQEQFAQNHENLFSPKLENLTAFKKRKKGVAVNLDHLAKEMSINTTADFNKEIFSIIPYGKKLCQSFMLYKDEINLIEQTSIQLAKKYLEESWHMEMKSYKETVESFFGQIFNNIPISNSDYSLMPFSTKFRPMKYLWINPGQIFDLPLSKEVAPTMIELTNGFTIEVDRKKRRVIEKMKQSFLTHGIIKRDSINQPVNITMEIGR